MKEFTPTSESKGKSNSHKPVSRRKFLKATGLGLAGAIVSVSVPSIYEGVENTVNKEELERNIEALEKELSQKYGVEIKVWHEPKNDGPEGGRSTGLIKESLKERSLYRSYKSLISLKKVLEHYPPDLIKNNVSGIEIVHALKPDFPGQVAEGATPEAVTSFGGQITIRAGYQSALSYKATFGDNLDANVLHHEIAHALTENITDEEWKGLYPDAQYVGNDWKKIKDRPQGFAMQYGAKSLREDIATTAELLFTNPGVVEQLTKNDAVLRAKVEFLKNWYQTQSNGKIRF